MLLDLTGWATRLSLLLAIFALPSPARAQSDDVSAASRSVVRVVVVQIGDGQVIDFGHGTGFAVARNRIVTNAHVVALAVEDPDNVQIGVVPSEGRGGHQARIVAVDPSRDLALLEMREGSVTPASLYTGRLEPGMPVAALGYPGNVDLATARSMQDYVTPLPPTRSMGNYSDLRQGDSGPALVHTADIARGHSGGPLVDGCGRVIGVNRLITRNDMGDATFGFAIPIRSVIGFLREARQPIRQVDEPCVSREERQREADARAEREGRARDADEARRLREGDQRRSEALAARAEARETQLGVAVLLLVLAMAAGAGASIFLAKDRHRPALITGGVAVALLLGAAITFFARPSLLAPIDEEGSQAASATGDRFVGANLCRLDRARSRITVSQEASVRLGWAAGGCVNGRTQYAQDGAVWRRVLVPTEEETVTVAAFNPSSGDYRVDRYLLDGAAMAEARRLRQRVEQRGCTGDADARARLADRQRDLASSLPRTPNEQLVYRCEPVDRDG